jgi:hypothetical protein
MHFIHLFFVVGERTAFLLVSKGRGGFGLWSVTKDLPSNFQMTISQWLIACEVNEVTSLLLLCCARSFRPTENQR